MSKKRLIQSKKEKGYLNIIAAFVSNFRITKSIFILISTISIFLLFNIQEFSANIFKLDQNCDTQALKALWEFDNNSGTTINDKIGNYDGKIINNATLTGGHVSGAIILNGDSQFIEIGKGLLGSKQYTISTWFKTEKLGKQIIFSSNNGSNLKIWPLFITDRQTLGTMINNNEFTGSSTIKLGKWYHGTFVYNKNSILLYLNGKLEKLTYGSFSSLSSTGYLAGIGGDGIGNYFKGKIDNLAIFKQGIDEKLTKHYFEHGIITNCNTIQEGVGQGLESSKNKISSGSIAIKTTNYNTLKTKTGQTGSLLKIKFKTKDKISTNTKQEIIGEIESDHVITNIIISINGKQNIKANLINYENGKWFFYKNLYLKQGKNEIIATVTNSLGNQNSTKIGIMINSKMKTIKSKNVTNTNSGVRITYPHNNDKINSSNINIEAEYYQKDIIRCDIIKNDKQRQKFSKKNINNNILNYNFEGLKEGIYKFKVVCLGKSGNYYYDTVENIHIDKTAPTLSIDINNGNKISQTKKLVLDLSYNGKQDLNNKCRYSDNDFKPEAWQECSKTKIWNLTGSYGIKEIKYEVKDEAGNISQKINKINYINKTKPEALNLNIRGINTVGQQLFLDYLYYSKENIPEGKSQYKWLTSDTSTGEFVEIPFYNKNNILLENSFKNKWLKFEVIPIPSMGSLSGSKVFESDSIIIHGSGSVISKQFSKKNSYINISQINNGTTNTEDYISTIILPVKQKLNLSEKIVNEKITTAQVNDQNSSFLIKNVRSKFGIKPYKGDNIENVTIDLNTKANDLIIASESASGNLIYINISNKSKIYSNGKWDGTIKPTNSTNLSKALSGLTILSAISIAEKDAFLLIDKKIKITMSGSIGDPYFSYGSGNAWQQINNKCDNINGLGLSFPNNCFIKTNNSTIIWTHYLTNYSIQKDLLIPTIKKYTLSKDNSFIDIHFSEKIFGNLDLNTGKGTGSIKISNFNIVLNNNSNTVSSISISGAKAYPLEDQTGTGFLIRLNLDIQGTPTGNESFEIIINKEDNIFNSNGNPNSLNLRTGDIPLNIAPSATGIYIDGSGIIGELLIGNYTYSGHFLEKESKFTWYKSKSKYSEKFEIIQGENSLQYTPNEDDNFKFISFEVTPSSNSGTIKIGPTFKSTPIGPIKSLHLLDYSSSTSAIIDINSSSSSFGNIGLQDGINQIKLNDFQKLNLGKNSKSIDSRLHKIGENNISLQKAFYKIGEKGHINKIAKTIKINSGISGKDIGLYSSENFKINITDGTNFYGKDSWDGTISAAIDSNWSITPPLGTSNQGTISIGSDEHILFDKKIKIEINSTSGYPYYSSNGSDWTIISQECNDGAASKLIFPDICFIWEDGKTKIWTYHFTDFGVFNSSGGILNVESSLVINSGAISIGYPNSLSFPDTNSNSDDQDVYIYSDDYFWVEDLKASSSGYHLTMSVGNMTGSTGLIPESNIKIKISSGVTTLSGSIISQIGVPLSTASGFNIFTSASPITVLERNLDSLGKIGKYGIKPTFKITIPAFQSLGSYISVLSFDIIED